MEGETGTPLPRSLTFLRSGSDLPGRRRQVRAARSPTLPGRRTHRAPPAREGLPPPARCSPEAPALRPGPAFPGELFTQESAESPEAEPRAGPLTQPLLLSPTPRLLAPCRPFRAPAAASPPARVAKADARSRTTARSGVDVWTVPGQAAQGTAGPPRRRAPAGSRPSSPRPFLAGGAGPLSRCRGGPRVLRTYPANALPELSPREAPLHPRAGEAGGG